MTESEKNKSSLTKPLSQVSVNKNLRKKAIKKRTGKSAEKKTSKKRAGKSAGKKTSRKKTSRKKTGKKKTSRKGGKKGGNLNITQENKENKMKKGDNHTNIRSCEWIYLDNTIASNLCTKAEQSYKKNIKAISMTPENIKNTIEQSKNYILNACNTDNGIYSVYFTSGEIESNRIILCCAVNAYKKIRNTIPHVVISSTEHNSILTYAQSLYDSNQIELSIIRPNSYGCILSNTVDEAIKPNTCLVLITYINHELGSVNNIEKIAGFLHEKRIPLHSDCTYLFGKHKLDLQKTKIDSATISFDKINGPVGVGALIINNNFFNGYKLNEHSTTLNNKRQYNVPAIIASIDAAKVSLTSRKLKNKKITKFRNEIIEQLGKKFQILTFANFMKSDAPPLDESKTSKNKVVILGPPIDNVAYYTPSILSFVLISSKNKSAKNIQHELSKKGILIGLPNLDDREEQPEEKNILNVYDEIGMPKEAQQYIIKLSLSDDLTANKVKKVIDALKSAS